MLHAYLYIESGAGILLYHVMMANVKIRLMQNDGSLLHWIPTYLGIIVSGNTLCIHLNYVLAYVSKAKPEKGMIYY